MRSVMQITALMMQIWAKAYRINRFIYLASLISKQSLKFLPPSTGRS